MKADYTIQSGAGTIPSAPAFCKQTWRKWLRAGFLAGSLTVIAAFWGGSHEAWSIETQEQNTVFPGTDVQSGDAHHPREKTYIKRKWGVEVMYVQQTAAGYMLEFRYKVLDAEKAKPLFVRATKPVLIDAATGAELIVPTPPTTGALRNSNAPIAGRTYWMFFANPGKLVKPGQRVSIKIGDFRVDDIVVK